MGYCSKRRRAKRRRTKSLNAIKRRSDTRHGQSTSVDSSVDSLEGNSSHTTFCSTYSRLSNKTIIDGNTNPPWSIFLDDNNNGTLLNNGTDCDIHIDGNEMEQESLVNVGNTDSLSAFPDTTMESMSESPDDTDTIEGSMSSSFDNTTTDPNHHSTQFQSHPFDQVTGNETASYQIMSLLDSSGAPRICYDRLIALLKKLTKNDGFDVQKALNRQTLMERLTRKSKTLPSIESSFVNKQQVFRFRFLDMLQDLVNGTRQHLQDILPHVIHDNNAIGREHELWNTQWMKNTFAMDQFQDFDPQNDIMLPVILYMDKTGTDVNQRYSLEPVLFSLAAIPREQRESRHSWRHLGFVPQKQNHSDEESTPLLQFYHDCLSYLLEGLKEAQRNPPTITIQIGNGHSRCRRALLPLMLVMGDQLSQDTLCGRLKSNSGGAGRVHRSCMCSYLNIDDPYHQCKKVNVETLRTLISHAVLDDEAIESILRSRLSTSPNSNKEGRSIKSFLQKRRAMFKSILRHPFTTHPINNAFENINFGSWHAGIYDATFDDFMHSVEGGMVSYITETVYDGLTKKEKETIEELTRPFLEEQRCSVISHYPRWRLQPGFTRQTLMTSGERVGSLLALSLSLNDPTIRETIRIGHGRQIQKYLDMSTESSQKKSTETDEDSIDVQLSPHHADFYLNQHMHTLDDHCIRHTLEQMIRHGFQITLLEELDSYQINQMMWHCSEIFKNIQYPDQYPTENIVDVYTDLGPKVIFPKQTFVNVKYALQTEPSKLMKKHRLHKVDGTVGKHLSRKRNKKGEGSSAAILTNDMGTLVVFLEYVLCYHAFCKYSWSLPLFLQQRYENIKSGNRYVIEYFQKLIYRGNASVDSRFPKIHAQCRMADNMLQLNTVMNFCCETGERLLKTEAKGISRTAQQRGKDTFLTQTMSRIMDRSILDSFGMYLDIRNMQYQTPNHITPSDKFGRTHPHFVYEVQSGLTWALDRKNQPKETDKNSGVLSDVILASLKKLEPQMLVFRIYNEVRLRDNSCLRASPNYANSGPWYDFANVTWEGTTNEGTETYLLPARCLCFFPKECQQSGNQEIMALIHTADQSSMGNIPGRPDTLLTRNYRMQYNHKGQPVLHVVPVASIDAAIRCFPHVPSKELFNHEAPGITYLLPRNHWSYIWMATNDLIQESNSPKKLARRKGTLISLSGSRWLESVRLRYQTYINANTPEDL